MTSGGEIRIPEGLTFREESGGEACERAESAKGEARGNQTKPSSSGGLHTSLWDERPPHLPPPPPTLRPCLCVQSDEVTSVAESVGPRGVPCPSHPGKARVEFCPAFWVTASVHRNHGAHVRAVCSTTCDRKRSKI